jgi:hypothetical protein
MKTSLGRIALGLIVVACSLPPVAAQYAFFGQNKITYERFDWKVYESPHFDIHYYEGLEPFLEEIVSYAESAYLKLSTEFDHELRWRVPMIIYKNHAEFEQTNIQLSEIPEATLAFAEPLQNRMVFPVDSPPDFLYALLTHELTHIFQFSFFFEGNIGRVIQSRPPLWLMEGLASYMAQDESSLDKMVIRDAVVNNVLPPLQALDFNTFFAYRFGHAVFDFIEQEHGKEGLRTFIFEYRKVLLTNNIPKAIEDAFGYDIDEFNRRFNRYLRQLYFPVLLEKKSPDEYGREIGIDRGGAFTFGPSLSPSGELIAALAAPKMEIDLVVISAEDGSTIKNVTKGWTNKYRYLSAQSFHGKKDVSWSPIDDHVAVFARKENKRVLLIFDALKGKMLRMIDLGEIVQGSSPVYSPDGRKIAFEGNFHGVVDIWEYNLETDEIRNLTQDDQWDANPTYSSDGESMLYNRRIGPYWKVFSVDTSDPSRKTQITFGPSSDIQPSYSADGNTIYFSSDRNKYKVYNIYSLSLETGLVNQYTDVTGGCFSPIEMAESATDETQLVFTAFFRGSFRLYRMPVTDPVSSTEVADITPEPVQPFEPPLQLTLDEDNKRPYKAKWDLDAPSINVGVTNDGTLLTNTAVTFSDLLGDQRISILAQTLSTFTNIRGNYLNIKRRLNWGASVYDYRDFFLSTNTAGGAVDRDQVRRFTGGDFFIQYPINRHYRIDSSVGIVDRSQDTLFPDPNGGFTSATLKDTFATISASIVGDTTRFQSWGPFQGKRFNVTGYYGKSIAGDIDNELTEVRADFRFYKQATRRSLLAWRLAGIMSMGDLPNNYAMGGINQLRGFEFREFFGTQLVWSNLEFRFPLVDTMNFPILGLQNIRGFLFLDVGAAALAVPGLTDNKATAFADPVFNLIRVDPEFSFWDTENSRLQDGRASYGFGFHFFFLGGLQFNWAWAQRLNYTQFIPIGIDPNTGFVEWEPSEADGGDLRMDFYIIYDW